MPGLAASFGGRRSRALAWGLAAAVCPSALASWLTAPVVDPTTLEEVPAAVVRNAEGFSLAVYRAESDGRIVGAFQLPSTDRDFLDSGRPPVVRTDQGPAQRLIRLSGELKSIGFLLFGGPGEPVIGVLRELMDGSQLELEYPLHGGGFKVARFSLAGAKETIAGVLGIEADVAPEARDLARGHEAALTRCLEETKKKRRERCLEALSGCAASTTAAELEDCLRGTGSG